RRATHLRERRAHLEQPSPTRPQHVRSEEHTSELQSRENLVCRPLLEKKHSWSICMAEICCISSYPPATTPDSLRTPSVTFTAITRACASDVIRHVHHIVLPQLRHLCPVDNQSASSFFFSDEPAPTELYTLSLHDALPISPRDPLARAASPPRATLAYAPAAR